VAELTCDSCGDPIDDEVIRRGERVFCCEACAFEAGRSQDCGGRGDSHLPHSTAEPAGRWGKPSWVSGLSDSACAERVT